MGRIMSDEFDELQDDLGDDEEVIEAYCMTCRDKTPMDHPQPIWTRRGTPGTRGTSAGLIHLLR